MSVRIVTARPHRLFPAVVAELGQLHARGERAILLVPEQFTLAAERELMERLRLDGLFFIDVLSPSRLYEHVLSSAGRDGREPLGDVGRRMALSTALERLEDKLPYYGGILSRRGFVEKLSALLTDLKRGGMTAESLNEYASDLEDGLQKAKLQDLSRIYQQYQAVLGDRFSDSEDQLAYVAGKLEPSGFLHGKHLYVYGFDTLPEQLMRLLVSAASICQTLVIALICDGESAKDGELFAPIRQGVGRFRAMLGQEVAQQPLKPEPLAHAPAIAHLDQALFARKPAAFQLKPDGVYFFESLSPYDEATLMAREVLWLREQGVALDKIAVLYPDSDGYAFAVQAALTESGLPFYTDRQMPSTAHGLVRFLLGALHAMADGWRTRDLLTVLKSGYAPLTFDEICDLENYVFSCGIDRLRWLMPFVRVSRTDKQQHERCEPLRKRLIEPLQKARQAIVNARSAAASLTAVFELLTDVNAYEHLQQEEADLLEHGFLQRAHQNSQIWQAILTLLDQLARLSGSARIPLKHIASRLECGFFSITLAALPPAAGMLHAGALGHLLAEEADAVFLLGLNDGLLSKETDSLLTPGERLKTQTDTGCFLGLTDENRSLLAKLDLKRAMTLPKRYLFLSSARTAPDGTPLRTLSLIKTIQEKLLPGMAPAPEALDALPLAPAQALGQLGPLMRDPLAPLWQQRLNALLRSPETAPEAMRLLRSLRFDGAAQALKPEQARLLYGDDAMSVSRLETFAECAFKHFVNYGLRPHVLREWKVDPIDTGNFYHAGLNHFAHLAQREKDYPAISSARVDELAKEAIEPLMGELMSGPMGDGERSLARFAMARNALNRAVHAITKQLAAGRFNLYRTEASFGYEGGFPPIVLVLSDGREIALRGRIDRIDRYDTPDSVYLRVIDYKSYQQRLDAARTWWGLQLQLLLYLDVCTSAIPNAKPAGAFYFYVADPLIKSDTDLKSYVENKLRNEFHLRGIALSDVEILNAMDSGDVPYVLSPLYLKSGGLKKNATAFNEQQLAALLKHAREVATNLADRLFGGETHISPIRDSSRTSCDLCEFRAVCRFDITAPDAVAREVPSMSMDEMRKALTPNPEQEESNKKRCYSYQLHV